MSRELSIICPNCPDPIDAAAALEAAEKAGEPFICFGPEEVPNLFMRDEGETGEREVEDDSSMAEDVGNLIRGAELEQIGTFMVCGATAVERAKE